MSKISSINEKEMLPILNGRLEFDHNMATQTVTVTFTTANRDQSVPHNLNKIGVNYLQASKTVAGHVVTGKTSPTTKTIYLQATVVGKYTLVLF